SFEETHKVLAEADGTTDVEGIVNFQSDKVSGKIQNGTFTGKLGDVGTEFELKYTTRKSPTMGAKAPEGAVVLFDGSSLDAWQTNKGAPIGWKIADNGAMQIVPGTGTIESKEQFNDMQLHLEFR